MDYGQATMVKAAMYQAAFMGYYKVREKRLPKFLAVPY
jgi:hypothetical protein